MTTSVAKLKRGHIMIEKLESELAVIREKSHTLNQELHALNQVESEREFAAANRRIALDQATIALSAEAERLYRLIQALQA